MNKENWWTCKYSAEHSNSKVKYNKYKLLQFRKWDVTHRILACNTRKKPCGGRHSVDGQDTKADSWWRAWVSAPARLSSDAHPKMLWMVAHTPKFCHLSKTFRQAPTSWLWPSSTLQLQAFGKWAHRWKLSLWLCLYLSSKIKYNQFSKIKQQKHKLKISKKGWLRAEDWGKSKTCQL